ncbi:hypothetical protein FQR65_LT20218 [Abscondita terminalis]|nr:hypothetical protein FQR65_LT20218 [Abscondita terminalis]
MPRRGQRQTLRLVRQTAATPSRASSAWMDCAAAAASLCKRWARGEVHFLGDRDEVALLPLIFSGVIMAIPNRRSKNITQGISRSPNRSMYYAMGYEKEDFDKPMVGIANGHSTITPCNSGLQKLADIAIKTVKDSGGNPQVFGTPTISDVCPMGTEGMK